jgi:hypothetical protein
MPARIANPLHRLAHRIAHLRALFAIGLRLVWTSYLARKASIRVNLPFGKLGSHVSRVPDVPVSRVSRCFVLSLTLRE